ncbi:MAG: FtsX-like permease family protein [Planctomycetes bacterium]|nr:FtsX-like permease family protein [Planctomycetota bacterium]
MSFAGVLTMALEGLRRKKGRASLTALGIFVSVLALTLIIGLGEGLTAAISDTLTSDDNLRQILLMPGFGERAENKGEEIVIIGEMSEARRARLKRAAMARAEMRVMAGRRTSLIDDASIARLNKIDHVTGIRPLVFERYDVTMDDQQTQATLTFGLDTERKRFAQRVVAGNYFSGPRAGEVLVHEYLLYQWGFVTEAQQANLVGKQLTLKTQDIAAAGAGALPQGITEALRNIEFTEEEHKALTTILPKVAASMGGREALQTAASKTLTIVGILRENEPSEPVAWGEVSLADVFLPDGTAQELFSAGALSAQLGYQRAMVYVDDPVNVVVVEEALKHAGYSAYSVASFVKQAQQALGIVTIILSFLTGVALIVATLGIVNTMVTSVLERTREIGIWKAVGATDLQVQAIFVTESALIGLVGGLVGLGAAAAAMIPGNILARRMILEQTTLPFSGNVFQLPLYLILAGPALGAAVAVLAAIYPARRAAKVDPVKALRHD